jgi:hypothetical protein
LGGTCDSDGAELGGGTYDPDGAELGGFGALGGT